MSNRLSEAIGLGLILGALHGAAQAAPVSPSFTTGTVTTHSETTTTVTENIRSVDFMTGESYTVNGLNVTWDGPPALGANYSQVDPLAAFQFTETYLGPGQSNITEITRVTESFTVTDSVSVFTQ
jgi:hypothetical protein